MKVELIDLKKRYEEEREDLLNIFDSVLKNGSLVLTDEVFDEDNRDTENDPFKGTSIEGKD